MKRAQELIPLSRFHRSVLFTAQNCLTFGARFSGYPIEQHARRTYLMEQWPTIETHFQVLQETLNTKSEFEDELIVLIKSMKEEQEAVVKSVSQDIHLPTDESLNQIGKLLELHVRNTERKLFQCIQKEVNIGLLQKIGEVVKIKSLYSGLLDIKRT
jgi:hypothetical protein